MVMIVINILITILNEAYGELRTEIKDDYDLIDYVADAFKDFYQRHILRKKYYVYKHFDYMDDFKRDVDSILKYVDEVWYFMF